MVMKYNHCEFSLSVIQWPKIYNQKNKTAILNLILGYKPFSERENLYYYAQCSCETNSNTNENDILSGGWLYVR